MKRCEVICYLTEEEKNNLYGDFILYSTGYKNIYELSEKRKKKYERKNGKKK